MLIRKKRKRLPNFISIFEVFCAEGLKFLPQNADIENEEPVVPRFLEQITQ